MALGLDLLTFRFETGPVKFRNGGRESVFQMVVRETATGSIDEKVEYLTENCFTLVTVRSDTSINTVEYRDEA